MITADVRQVMSWFVIRKWDKVLGFCFKLVMYRQHHVLCLKQACLNQCHYVSFSSVVCGNWPAGNALLFVSRWKRGSLITSGQCQSAMHVVVLSLWIPKRRSERERKLLNVLRGNEFWRHTHSTVNRRQIKHCGLIKPPACVSSRIIFRAASLNVTSLTELN